MCGTLELYFGYTGMEIKAEKVVKRHFTCMSATDVLIGLKRESPAFPLRPKYNGYAYVALVCSDRR